MNEIMLDRIKILCKEKGITILQLEKQVGLSGSTIRTWRTSRPSIDKVEKIASFFNVSTDWLMGRSSWRESAETILADKDFVSLQRARSRMSPQDWDKAMNILHISFEQAFSDDDTPKMS